ncbi:hypothetical protein [Legionella spiritensis]|nr:hypothetical protein [Legionella spiritensis]SNV36139.1 SidC homolog [Legionella spiritensis]
MGDPKSKVTNPILDFKTLYQQVVTMIKEGNLKFNTISEELKNAFLKFNDSYHNEQLELISNLSKIQDLPEEMDNVVKKYPWFDTLPDHMLKEIGSHIVEEKDKSAFVATGERVHTLFQADRLSPCFLQYVAYGKQDEAENLFTRFKQEEKKQELLCKPGTFTDYSHREFSCTAYEYAYWAKDKHMCRMLEKQMDDNTKSQMLKRCEDIEKNGLTYKQNGVEVKGSKHFDFTPLKTALKNYIDGYDNWYKTNNWTAMKAAWMQVGMAQRELPVHVINEYCRKDRSFDPAPKFNEDSLPREVAFYNYQTGRAEVLFPLQAIATSGLGVDFALYRGAGGRVRVGESRGGTRSVPIDLAAVSRLDEVRSADLTQSLENLKAVDPVHKLGK